MPDKNFTDPTTLLLMPIKVNPVQILYQPIATSGLRQYIRVISDFSPVGRPVTTITRPPAVLRTAQQPLPKPPVGKMLVNTFPPIYKERVNSVGLADTPRIFPTIFVTHKNT